MKIKKVKISELYTYPVKGCEANPSDVLHIGELGVADDRKWMIVDEFGNFVNQKRVEHIVRLKVIRDENQWLIRTPVGSSHIDQNHWKDFNQQVKLYKETFDQVEYNENISALLTNWLNQPLFFIRFKEGYQRTKYIDRLDLNLPVNFVDGYPIHIVNQSSLEELASRLNQRQISSLRFRPNIVIHGLDPYEEDQIDRIVGENIELKLIKKTARCPVPNINPQTTSSDLPVFNTLARYRLNEKRVDFGIYASVIKTGKVSTNEHLSLFFN